MFLCLELLFYFHLYNHILKQILINYLDSINELIFLRLKLLFCMSLQNKKLKHLIFKQNNDLFHV